MSNKNEMLQNNFEIDSDNIINEYLECDEECLYTDEDDSFLITLINKLNPYPLD